jgi:hypothetical protein
MNTQFKNTILLVLILCLSNISTEKIKSFASQTINPLLDIWSNNYLFRYPSAFAPVKAYPVIYNSMSCPAGKGGVRGFQTLRRTDLPPQINAENWAFKFQCSPGDSSDFVDVKAPTVKGVSTFQTKVDVCKTTGRDHILVPTGNTCTCPDGYVINSIKFVDTPTQPNPIGVACTCAKVKSTAKLIVCTRKLSE